MAIKHLDEFNAYYNMGPKRSYKAVSEQFDISNRTVESWGKKEEWSKEVQLRDYQKLKEQRKDNLKNRQKLASDFQIFINALLGEYGKKIKNGDIKLESVTDLEKLVKLTIILDNYVDLGYETLLQDKKYNKIEEEQLNQNKPSENLYSNKTLQTLETVLKSSKLFEDE